MAAINLGEHVQRRVQVSARITARAGRLVAARLQTFDGAEGRKGLSLGLGAAAPGAVWYFPEGYLADGLTERFQVFNPGNQEAVTEFRRPIPDEVERAYRDRLSQHRRKARLTLVLFVAALLGMLVLFGGIVLLVVLLG